MTTIHASINTALAKRSQITYGIVLIAVGLFIYLIFGLNTQAGLQTTYGTNLAGSQALPIPDIVVPAQMTVMLMAGIAVFFGAFQLARGVRSTGWLIGILAATFVIAFLTWAAQGKSFNLTGMLSSSFVRATPIALAALCGVISERSAVINIGIEGIMLMAAQAAVVAAIAVPGFHIPSPFTIPRRWPRQVAARMFYIIIIRGDCRQGQSGVAAEWEFHATPANALLRSH